MSLGKHCVWQHINGWVGRIYTRDAQDIRDVGYVYLCEHSKYIVDQWVHQNDWRWHYVYVSKYTGYLVGVRAKINGWRGRI